MRAYERFLNYVKINTPSSEVSETHPSFAGEFDLANILVNELRSLGCDDAFVDEHCYVYAHLPATTGYEGKSALGLIAHLDTANEAPGDNISPIIHESYSGDDIKLGSSGKVLSIGKFPFLKSFIGENVITSDGTTLLGADDKAGIAEIMTVLDVIQSENIPHGPISIAFTPDEEIGGGADLFNLDIFNADFAYTMDGGDIDCIEYENFNAASAVVTITGTSVHPGYAKDVMINASNVAQEFHALLPVSERPETTEDREGFFHLTDMSGNVSLATLKYIIRDFEKDNFEKRKLFFKSCIDRINLKYGENIANLEIEDSYYNMLEKILPHMHLIESARIAIKELGYTPIEVPIRGGTDGSRLSFMGLPCPNLGTGGYNFHGVYECITIERMDKAVQMLLSIISRL